jgi:hypothetical protein
MPVPYANAAPKTMQAAVDGAVRGMAGVVASSATRSLIDGSDFGDNLVSALPGVLSYVASGWKSGDSTYRWSKYQEAQRAKAATAAHESQHAENASPPANSSGVSNPEVAPISGSFDDASWAADEFGVDQDKLDPFYEDRRYFVTPRARVSPSSASIDSDGNAQVVFGKRALIVPPPSGGGVTYRWKIFPAGQRAGYEDGGLVAVVNGDHIMSSDGQIREFAYSWGDVLAMAPPASSVVSKEADAGTDVSAGQASARAGDSFVGASAPAPTPTPTPAPAVEQGPVPAPAPESKPGLIDQALIVADKGGFGTSAGIAVGATEALVGGTGNFIGHTVGGLWNLVKGTAAVVTDLSFGAAVDLERLAGLPIPAEAPSASRRLGQIYSGLKTLSDVHDALVGMGWNYALSAAKNPARVPRDFINVQVAAGAAVRHAAEDYAGGVGNAFHNAGGGARGWRAATRMVGTPAVEGVETVGSMFIGGAGGVKLASGFGKLGEVLSASRLARFGRAAAKIDEAADLSRAAEDVSVAGRTYEGGAYGRLSAEKGVIERHHAPADSVSPYTTYSGPAIQMDYADHLLTSSHGSQGLEGALYRADVKALIDSGNMRGAMAKEIWDIRRVSTQSVGSPTKYNAATRQMLDYAYAKGLLNKAPR